MTFYVEVPDVEALTAKAGGLGATRMMGPEEVTPGLVIGLFTDPEGHTVGVTQTTQQRLNSQLCGVSRGEPAR